MRGTNNAKEMKRRASQRRATHKTRRASLMHRAQTRIKALEAARPKMKAGSKASSKTAKSAKPEKR